MKRLIPKSVFAGKPDNSDSLAARRREPDGDKKNPKLLTRAENAWMALDKLRNRRQRNYNYVYIDQWSDWVIDDKGNPVRERERIAKRTGGVALQNNHLVKIIHSLEGLYTKQATIPVCFATIPDADDKSDMMTNALQTNWNKNRMSDILISEMGEMLIGGMPVCIEEKDTINGVEDVYTFVVEPSHFFFESSGIDPLHRDISLIGHFEDFTKAGLLAKIAHSKYDAMQIEHIYKEYNKVDWRVGWSTQFTDKLKDSQWNNPEDGYYRVYHIWTKEQKLRYRCKDIMDFEQPLYRIEPEQLPIIQEENRSRLAQGTQAGMAPEDVPLIEFEAIFDVYWHYQMLAPDGTILEEYDNPYEHKDHPYTFKLFEYVNGDVIPYISSVIDQQRYINRLVTLFDLVIQASCKGITLIPKSIIPKNMTEAEFARSCRELGNYIFYDDANGRNQNKPEIIQSNTNMTGITDMLQLQLGFIPEITSVSDSLQGKSPGSNVAASRYAMETQNATTSITGCLEKFADFERELAKKKMKMIHQFYTSPKNVSIKQSSGYVQYATYDPVSVQDIDFEVHIEMSPKSPVFRMTMNELIAQMWQAGAIDAQTMLQMSYLPGGSATVKQLQAATEAMQAQAAAVQAQQGAQQQGGQQQPVEQLSPSINPAAMNTDTRPYVRGEDIDSQTIA